MSSSALPTQTPSISSLQTLSLKPTSAYLRDIETDIRDFWSSFPCPPPWKPRLLFEVNATRLDTHVGRTVQSFLAGKCHIRQVLPGSGDDYNLDPSDFLPGLDLRPTETPDAGSSIGDPSTSHHKWCDATCQLSFGCAVLFVVAVLMVALVICTTRHRVRHKMAATRPSRQQLQMSTSTSDAVNCTEFSNLEVGANGSDLGVHISVAKLNLKILGDEDFIYPPFRHRGLPHPPLPCHPSCDPKWNCANCSSCHPLMRMSPPDLYYSRAYSVVYETVDEDEDDAVQRSENDDMDQLGAITPVTSASTEQTHSCVPCQVSPTNISTVQIRPRQFDDATANRLIAETGFNGDDSQANTSVSTIPKYFEVEQSCALSGHQDSVTYGHNFMTSFGVNNISGERYNFAFTANGNNLPVSSSCQLRMLSNSPSQPSALSHVQRDHVPSFDELYKYRPYDEYTAQKLNEQTNSRESRKTDNESNPHSSRHTEHSRLGRGSICYFSDPGMKNTQQSLTGQAVTHLPYSTHVCTSTSTFLTEIPNQYFCPSCHQDNTTSCSNHQALIPTSQLLLTNPTFQCVGPDLLKEASLPSRRHDKEVALSNDVIDDNNEVPLRKPVLALHSQYFAKTWLA